ncbi:MAG: septal ring lytic transglycosylase RlpA family protein [Flavobacteriaceae bacterium]|nr:septal ring lytic transglycosylase RlpA family protein [Flavobacteriaceae bacterium]
MKRATLAVILLIFLSFTAMQTNESVKVSLHKDTISHVSKDTTNTVKELIENDTLNDKNTKDLSLKGRVSWYGGKFHGRLTSSGERYDMNELTASHKTLPFGTKVRIRNPENGKEVIVRITDRGPFIPKRVFDLSKAAFAELSDINVGVLDVTYEIL